MTLAPWAVGAALVGGLVFSAAIHAWGVAPVAMGLVVVVAARSWVRPQAR
jgi:hypothetical protein